MSDPERETAEALERRVRSLESAVRALTEELRVMRGMPAARSVRAPEGAAFEPQREHSTVPRSPPTAPAPTAARPAAWLPAEIDFESLIGRYGTLVLSTVSALAAVGLFLNWAIEKGFLGPQQRLGLGLITAAALAVGGMRLRRRERSFGASLLGLALAITHVCAWGAGPALKLVPSWGAFVLAAATSIALAAFAHAEDDEPLWSVGFSGAAIAPFVTASGRSNLFLLTAYGVAVLASAGYAMGGRRWLVAARIFLLAALLYTLALATGYEQDFGPPLAMALPLAVALLGVIPWVTGWARRERIRALGALAALAALRSGIGMDPPVERVYLAAMIAAAGVFWLAMVDRTHAVADPMPATHRYLHEGDWLDAAVLPLAFALSAVAALDASAATSGWALALAGGIFLATVMRLPQGSMRDAAVFATVLSALVAVLLILKGQGSEIIASIAVLCALAFAANRIWRSGSWTTLGLIGLAWTMLASLGQLAARATYQYTPFLTEPSAIAAVVLAAMIIAVRLARGDDRLERWLTGGAITWAFVWVHQEIAFAFNPTAATLFRVTYYAATSVAAVGVGRARHVPLLRHVGLALAILAAGTALYGARNLDAIGAKIGADLVAAAFLLAIAYWYRKRGGTSRRHQGLSTES